MGVRQSMAQKKMVSPFQTYRDVGKLAVTEGGKSCFLGGTLNKVEPLRQ